MRRAGCGVLVISSGGVLVTSALYRCSTKTFGRRGEDLLSKQQQENTTNVVYATP
jgi:hypothetical protein